MNDTLPPRTLALHEKEPCYELFMEEYEKIERELTAVTEQRDRLAAALNQISSGHYTWKDCVQYATDALQSLNQPTPNRDE